MSALTFWDVLLFIGWIATVLGMRSLLPAYFAEKGKNFASKQDVEELTRKVEGVKAQYSAELERLRADLKRASYIHAAQYETEFRIYKEVWESLMDVQRVIAALRPIVDHAGADSDEERRKRMKAYSDAHNAMETAVWKNKPFYSPAVHQELKKLRDLFYSEAIDYQHGNPHEDNHWRDYKNNLENISNQLDTVCEAIRKQLSPESMTAPA